MKKHNIRSLLTVICLVLLLGIVKFSFQQKNILSYDYFGLYLHLPAMFIYNDPAVSDLTWVQEINQTYNNTPSFYQLQSEGQYHIIRFFNGIAILLSPFFFMGHVYALMSNYPADGFSYPYQFAMMFAAWVYVLIGLIFLRKVLLTYFTDTITSLTLIALYLGTNLLFWTTFDAGAPHTILLSIYAMLIWFTIRWHQTPKKQLAMIIGLLLGLIIVSRPSEITAALIPLFWNVYNKESFVSKVKLVRQNFSHLIWLVAFTILAGVPQMLYFIVYTGKIFYSTYNDPQSGLDFTNPRFFWVLFSFRKGWFIYAPLMVFAIAGLFPLWKKYKTIALPISLHFLINLFLIASFTSLVSYGWRAFIQSYALLALPLAALIQILLLKKWYVKGFFTLLLAFFIWLSAIQGWQIMMGIIHSSRMTSDYYFRIFGQRTYEPEDRKLLAFDHYTDDKLGYVIPDTSDYHSKLLVRYTFEDEDSKYETDPLDSLNHAEKLDPVNAFSKKVKVPHRKITEKDHLWARVSVDYYSEQPINKGDLLLVCTYVYRGPRSSVYGSAYKYRTFKLVPDSLNQWQSFQVDYLSPEIVNKKDEFSSYIWYRGPNEVLIDDFSVIIFKPE